MWENANVTATFLTEWLHDSAIWFCRHFSYDSKWVKPTRNHKSFTMPLAAIAQLEWHFNVEMQYNSVFKWGFLLLGRRWEFYLSLPWVLLWKLNLSRDQIQNLPMKHKSVQAVLKGHTSKLPFYCATLWSPKCFKWRTGTLPFIMWMWWRVCLGNVLAHIRSPADLCTGTWMFLFACVHTGKSPVCGV